MLLTQSGMRSISVTHYHRILLSVRILVLIRSVCRNFQFDLLQSIVAVIPAFIVIALSYSMPPFIAGLVLYSFSSATFVPSLSTLISTVGESNQKGLILGVFRSIGALARALGPITASISKKAILLCFSIFIIFHFSFLEVWHWSSLLHRCFVLSRACLLGTQIQASHCYGQIGVTCSNFVQGWSI